MADPGRRLSSANYRPNINNTDEISLYRDNFAVLKVERGITLGLLKLVYSSDEANSGIILGVKPRLQNGVPCLITFDSTSLNHSEYDLIVQVDVNPGSESLPSASTIPLQHIEGGPMAPQNVPDPELDFCEEQMAADLIGIPSRRHQAVPEPNSHATRDIHVNTLPDHKAGHIPATQRSQDEANDKNPEPDSTGNPDDFHFNPEEFNFDINKVTPTQSDKGLRWPCDKCGKDYCSPSHLKRHWIIHTSFKPYKCRVCHKTFPFQWDLKRHMTKHTGNKRFKCPLCPKSFNTRKEVKCHSWLHTGKKQYKCQICQHEFSSPSNLKVHNRKHTGEKPYKCQYCPKAFHMQGHYMYHVRRHTGERPYKCDICGKGFSYSHNLNEHRNIHTGHKPYSCTDCDRKFSHRSTMKQHMFTHGGQKPYKCHLCKRSFVQSSNYRMHLQTHKKKEDRIEKCDLCGKELLSRRGVKDHRKRCLKRTIDRANAAPVSTDSTKKDKKKKGNYPCELCKKVFSYPKYFDKHMEDHTSGKIKDKSKKKAPPEPLPRNAKAQETQPGVIKCPLCKRKFSYIKCFKGHLQQKHAGVEVALPEGFVSRKAMKAKKNAQPAPDSTMATASSLTAAAPSNGQTQGIPYHVLNSLPRVHIQSSSKSTAAPTNVTIVYVPATPAQNQQPQKTPPTSAGSTGSTGRYVPIVPRPSSGPSGVTTSCATTQVAIPPVTSSVANSPIVKGSKPLSALAELSKKITMETDTKREETGSQAISALKRLSAQVGIQDGMLPLRAGETRPPSSEHLSMLEQLSKRIGDTESVSIEPVLDPQTQIPLRYPRMDQTEQEAVGKEAGPQSRDVDDKNEDEVCGSDKDGEGNSNTEEEHETSALKDEKSSSPKLNEKD